MKRTGVAGFCIKRFEKLHPDWLLRRGPARQGRDEVQGGGTADVAGICVSSVDSAGVDVRQDEAELTSLDCLAS